MIVSSQASLLFGSVLVGASSSLSFTLTNTGKGTVKFEGITNVSEDPAVFTIAANCVSLHPGHSCTVTVTFRPTAPGASSGELQIPFTPPQSLLRIPISGTAIAGTPNIAASLSSLAFGPTLEGNHSSAALTLTNTGNATLTISSVIINGPQSANFAANINATSLAPAQAVTVPVTFTPVAAGAFSANLQIAHNAPHSPLLIPLSGTGVTPKHKDSKEIKEAKEGHKDAKEITKDTKEVTKEGAKEVTKEAKDTVKDTKEAKETKEIVVEKVHDKTPIQEGKTIVVDRLPQLNDPQPAPTEAPPADDTAPTQHSFITPEERPQLGPRQPPKDDSPE